MKSKIIFLLFLILCFGLKSKSECELPGINQKIQSGKPDTSQVNLLLQTAWECRKSHIDTAIYFTEMAVKQSITLKYIKGEARGLFILGTLYHRQGIFNPALDYFAASLVKYAEIKDSIGISEALRGQGTVYRKKGQFNFALNLYIKSKNIKQRISDEKGLGKLYNSIGSLHFEMEEYEQALEYYEYSLDIKKKLKDEAGMGVAHSNTGYAHYLLGNLDEAKQHYKKSIEIRKKRNDRAGLAKMYSKVGIVHMDQEEYELAIQNYSKSLSILTELNDMYDIPMVLNNTAQTYLLQGDTAKSLKTFKQALDITIQTGAIRDQRTTLENIYYVYDEYGDYGNALLFYKQFVAINDSVKQQETNDNVAFLKHTLKTDLDNQLLQKDLRLKNTVLLFLLAVILVILGLIVLGIRSIRQKEILRKQKEAIQHITDIEDARTKAQTQIGENLHDILGSQLFNVKLSLEGLGQREQLDIGTSKEAYTKLLTSLESMYETVRRIARSLAPATLKKLGLEAALKSLKKDLEAVNPFTIDLKVIGIEQRLPEKYETEIYYIIQELAQNIVKHARASEAVIQLNLVKSDLNVTVEDNGVGFDPGKVRGKDGLGMRNVEARVKRLKGKLHVDSAPGKGATIIIDLPVKANG